MKEALLTLLIGIGTALPIIALNRQEKIEQKKEFILEKNKTRVIKQKIKQRKLELNFLERHGVELENY